MIEVALPEALTDIARTDPEVVVFGCTSAGALGGLEHDAGVARDFGARVIGLDFAAEMLRGAQRRGIAAGFVQGDAERMPLPDGAVTVVTCGFALRNFASLERALREMARVLVPGGRLALVEVDRPERAWIRAAHSAYFDRWVPRLGGWLSDPEAYRYLPDSTAYLPEAPKLQALLERVGFEAVRKRRFLLGAAQLLVAERRER